MRAVSFLLLALSLFAGWRESNISAIERVIEVYETRLKCLEHDEAIPCIERYPLEPRSDTLAKTFSMSFPKSFYKATLERDIKLLEKEKLCYGKALSPQEAERCFSR